MEVRLNLSPIDLDLTLGCGQTFRWTRTADGGWRGVIGDRVLSLRMVRGGVVARSSSGRGDLRDSVSRYLRTDDDIVRIQEGISARDDVLARGIEDISGLRLVKIDEWECLVSYVLATYANVPRISKMVSKLASEYGREIDGEYNSFPTVDELGTASVRDLEICGLGYRARYVHDICQQVDRGRIRSMRRLEYADLRNDLLRLPGVGDKVADCVALFGFGRLEAFPIDVWIERALNRLYSVRGSYRKLREFASDRFGPYAGYAQEYIYYNERVNSKLGDCLFRRRDGSCGRSP